MDQNKLLTELRSTLKAIDRENWRLESRDDCPSSNAVLHTPHCVVFFVLVSSCSKIETAHKKAQSEIAALSQPRKPSWPRDKYLVLLVTDVEFPLKAQTSARMVIEDRFYCRKFVLHVNGKPLQELLHTLPFWPITPSFLSAETSVSLSVKELLKDFDPELTSNLASMRPGVDGIADKIVEGKYQLIAQSSSGRQFTARESKDLPGIRLTGLDISNFRGIQCIDQKKMPFTADITIVYGPNGTGKTSIADALEWVVTGNISHIDTTKQSPNEPDPIVNLFSPDGTTKVTCYLDNDTFVSRAKDGRKETKQIDGKHEQDNRKVIDHVVGMKAPAGVTPLHIQHLRELFSGSHLLSQHNMRRFLELTNASDRFDTLTNMIGAEEFVRFREKTASVNKRLETTLRDQTYEAEKAQHESKNIENKMRQVRGELKNIQNILSKDHTPTERIQELIEILEQNGCILDKELLIHLQNESTLNHIDGVTSYLEPIITSKKKQVSDLLLKFENLKKSVPQKLKIHKELEQLRKESLQQKEMLSRLQNNHSELTEKLKQQSGIHDNLSKKRYEVETKHKQLSWLNSIHSEYTRSVEQLQEISKTLNSHLAAIRELEKELYQKHDLLGSIQSSLEKTNQQIANKHESLSCLTALSNRLQEMLFNHAEIKKLGEKASKLDQESKDLRSKLNVAKTQAKTAHSLTGSLQHTYEELSAGHETRQTLLARLYELVDSPKCTLCGREFSSVDEAKSTIKQQLTSVPKELTSITHKVEKARKDEENAVAKVRTLSHALEANESSLDDCRKQQAVVFEKVKDFVLECKKLSVILPEDNFNNWTDVITESLAKYQTDELTSEIMRLKDQKALVPAQIVKLQQTISTETTVIDKARHEKERLESYITNTQTEMISHKFDPQKLPSLECLSKELSLVTSRLEATGGQLVEQENLMKPLLVKDKQLRNEIANISERIVHEKKRLNACESIWIEFTSLCQAIDVNVDNIHNSIQTKKQTVLDTKVSLDPADSIFQELQQYALLERKSSDLQHFDEERKRLEKVLKSTQDTVSHLQRWYNRLKTLETEVSRQQAATVGAHLKQLEPILQLLYNRLNPHPVFGSVKVMVDEDSHTLDVQTMTNIEYGSKQIVVSPSKFFSDAQLNVLAISVFLAGALQQRWSRFRTLIIDDPIQQMDEMNVAAFLDLLRGLTGDHQFIVFTCSRDFYLLALDKLTCLNKTKPGRFCAYRLEGVEPAKLKVYCDTIPAIK